MKLIPRFWPAVCLALAAALVASDGRGAILVSGPWTIPAGQGNGPITPGGPGAVTVGDGTANSADGEMFAAPFNVAAQTITLANSGDKIRFTGNVQLTGTVGTAGGPRTQFRFGLFDADADDLGWPGYFIQNSSGTGTPQGTLSRKPVGNTSVYLSGTGASAAFAATQGNGVNFTDDTYALSLLIERSGNDLLLTSTITGATNGYVQSLSATDTTASTLGTYSFDRLAFLLGGNLDADQAVFSNLTIRSNVIPEPATWALGLVALIGGGLARQRIR